MRIAQWFRSRLSPIGLDVRSQSIHAAQLCTERDGVWSLRAAASVPRLEPGTELSVREARRIMAVLDRRGFEGGQFVVTPPDRGVLSALLELPPANSGAPIDQIAAIEVGRTLKRDPSSFEMAYWIVPSPPRGSEGVHAMAVACPHGASTELLNVLDDVGAEVVAIDVRAWALARACGRSAWRLAGVVELGWASGRLVLFQESRVVYERVLEEWSLRAVFDNMANVLETDASHVRAMLESLELSKPHADRRSGSDPLTAARRCLKSAIEALAKEIGVSLRYIAHRFATDEGPGEVGGVHVCGPGASLPGLVADLSERVGVKAGQVTPATLVRVPGDGFSGRTGMDDGPELVAALGLAMWKDVAA